MDVLANVLQLLASFIFTGVLNLLASILHLLAFLAFLLHLVFSKQLHLLVIDYFCFFFFANILSVLAFSSKFHFLLFQHS